MSDPSQAFILGTRGSDLALAQARMVESALRASGLDRPVEIRVIKTIGDKRPDLKLSEFSQGDQPVADKGIFTKELEEALLAGEIDIAVHSLKDVPTELGAEFVILAALERAPVEDVYLSRAAVPPSPGDGLCLPERGVVATSSVRRARQLRWLRPGLEVTDIRGNVPTRVRKLLDTPEWDGILLARAGLERLGILPPGAAVTSFRFEGRPVHAAALDARVFLPAAGQGAVAIESLKVNAAAAAACSRINHAPTFARVTAERHFLHRLQAGCQTPVGALTWLEGPGGATLAMQASVFDEASLASPPREATARGPAAAPEALADQLHALIHA